MDTDTDTDTDIESDDEIVLITHATRRLLSNHVGLKKQTRPEKLMRGKSTEMPTLSWRNCYPIIPVESENALLPILIPFRNYERGMMMHQPYIRVKQIYESCEMHGIQLEQALCLRRQHIKLMNPQVNDIRQLGLGNKDEKRSVPLEKLKQSDNIMQLNPNFILARPLRLVTYQTASEDSNFGEHRQVNWIEAEMCYGASTINCKTGSAVDEIMSKAKNYVKRYGPGAFVFAYGCGSKLRENLRALGISVLDSRPLDLKKVRKHQKTWCANKKGVILP